MSQFFQKFLGISDDLEFPFLYQHFVYWFNHEVIFEVIQVKYNPRIQKKEFIHLRFFKNKIKERIFILNRDTGIREGQRDFSYSLDEYFYEKLGLQPFLDLLFGDNFTPVRILHPSKIPQKYNEKPRYPVKFIFSDVSIFDLPEDLYSSDYQVHYFLNKLKDYINGPGVEDILTAVNAMLNIQVHHHWKKPFPRAKLNSRCLR